MINAIFYLSACIAILSTILVMTNRNAVHALLYLVVSLLAAAVIFFTLGAPFVGTLEIIIYAGAIMVLFVFVVMLLDINSHSQGLSLSKESWVGPVFLSLILLGELIFLLTRQEGNQVIGLSKEWSMGKIVSPKEVSLSLFTTYSLGIEIASFMLLGGLVGAYHLGRKRQSQQGKAKT